MTTDAQARKRVDDPGTPAAELAELAAAHPELSAAIYRHPNAYDGLREWIETHHADRLKVGTPAVSQPVPSSSAPAGDARPQVSWWDRPRSSLLTSVGIAVLALVVVGVIIGSTIGRIASIDADRADVVSMPIDSPAAGSDPTPVPTPEPSASAAASRIPSTCTALFSAAITATIQAAGYRQGTSARLNDPAGTSDGTLAGLMAGVPRLECTWHPSNTNTAGLETSVLEIDPATLAAVAARLQALGYASLDELGGVRYFFEKTGSDGVAYGESDMLRDGLWFATRWVQYGPDGYTADMVSRVFG
ncbi:MAG: uncharacterized protein JWP19_678 [Rhodoglobus sp.]|nr:uncharacterized protein [Rhodoglobus sp.]